MKWWKGIIIALFMGLCARFWQLQVVRATTYTELARANHVRQIPESAPRGLILDRYGRILAENRPSFNLTIEEFGGSKETVDALAELLSVSPDELRAVSGEARKPSLYRARLIREDIPLEEVAVVEARQLELAGAIIQFVPRRFYPSGSLAAHAVGYVGRISEEQFGKPGFEGAGPNDYVGQSGVELVYNLHLMGRSGVHRVMVNSHGRRERILEEVPPVWGDSVQLSLDQDLQRAVEDVFGEQSGAAVVLDPRNGQVLALASSPSFGPNFLSGRFNREQWQALVHDKDHRLQNRAIQGRYPPGSLFKLIVAAAALEEGVITPSTEVTCYGTTRLYGKVFHCHRASGHGAVNLHQALVQSCNSYFYQLGVKLQIETIARYARAFGLGRPTGIDLPYEVSGLIPDPQWKQRFRREPWYAGETVSVSVGQGSVLVTAIQMAQVAAILGTSGDVHRPRLFVTTLPAGAVATPVPAVPAEPVRRVGLRDSTWRVLQDAMWAVVNDGGTGWRARWPGVEVCGKTGTAQVASRTRLLESENMKRPERLRSHAWFVGYAPRVNPEVAVSVLVEHGGGGGQAAAPLAGRIFKGYFERATKGKQKSVRQAALARN
ncbi:MAG: penicillin-binding protein 2 [Acidobacteriota bacterium]